MKNKVEREQGRLSNTRQSILQVLEVRFQSVPNFISDRLNSLDDLSTLQNLLTQAVITTSLDDFIHLISSNSTNIQPE